MNTTAVALTIGAYIILLFIVAWLPARRADNESFFTGNRLSTWYMAAMAMIGAAMSGVTFISVPGSVASDSFSYMQMVAGFTIGQLVIAFVLVPLFYRLRVVSIYEYFHTRFGENSHKTGAAIFLVAKSLNAALKIFVVCTVTQYLLFDAWGVPLWANVAFTLFLVWLYTARGGVRSLIWTDSLHTICLIAGILLSAWFIMRQMDIDLMQTFSIIRDSDYSRIIFLDDPSSERYFWKMFFAGIFTLIAMTGLDQDMMQRNLSCRTKRDAQINIVITAVCQAIVILLLLSLGALLYIYSSAQGIALPHSSDAVFPAVAVNGGLPSAAGVVFLLGLIASTWSSAGSSLTSLTTSLTLDILPQSRDMSDKQLTRRRKTVHLLLSVVLCGVVLLFDHLSDDSAINLVFKIVSYAYGPLLGMFCFGMFTRRKLRDKAIWIIAIAAPTICAVAQWWFAEHHSYYIGFELLIYNALLTALGMWICSRQVSRAEGEKEI